MKANNNAIMREVAQLTPDQAVAWCEELYIDWQAYDPNDTRQCDTWVKALQARANDAE